MISPVEQEFLEKTSWAERISLERPTPEEKLSSPLDRIDWELFKGMKSECDEEIVPLEDAERKSIIDQRVGKNTLQKYKKIFDSVAEPKNFVLDETLSQQLFDTLYTKKYVKVKNVDMKIYNVAKIYIDSNLSETSLIYINGCCSDLEDQENSEAAILVLPNEVIIVGCNFSHPYVLCNKFVYGNSDGSGPCMLDYVLNGEECNGGSIHHRRMIKKITPDIVFNMLTRMFREFCNNEWH